MLLLWMVIVVWKALRCTLIVVAVVFAAGMVSAAPTVETLDNGARLVVEVDHSRPVASFRIYVGTGSVYEGRWLGSGVSHFVEHVIGQGTSTRSAEDISQALSDLGNAYNAYTAKDITCYYLTVSRGDISRGIDLISDMVLNATFPADEVETQRGIILREMAMDDDKPSRRIGNLLAETAFTTHPVRYRLIGYPDLFKALTRDDLVAYHHERYVPDNMVAVAVGDFDGDAVLAQLREILGALPRRPLTAAQLAQEPEQIAARRRVEVAPSLQRAYLQMAWPTVSIFNPDLHALDALSYYLSAGDSAELVRRLRDELGLVDSVYAYSATPPYDAGQFVVGAVLDPANLERVQAEVLAALDRVRKHPPTSRDLNRVIHQVAAAQVFAQETAEGRAETLGSNLLTTDDADFSAHYLAGIRAVTPQQVKRVVTKYFAPQHMTTVVLRPPVEGLPTG